MEKFINSWKLTHDALFGCLVELGEEVWVLGYHFGIAHLKQTRTEWAVPQGHQQQVTARSLCREPPPASSSPGLLLDEAPGQQQAQFFSLI